MKQHLRTGLEMDGLASDESNEVRRINPHNGAYFIANVANSFEVNQADRKSTRLNSSHLKLTRMPSSA